GDIADNRRELGFGIRRRLGQLLHATGQLLSLGEEGLLVVTLRLRDLLAERLLRRPEGLRLRDRRPAPHSGGQSTVDEVGGIAARTLGGFDGFGVLAEQLRVNHLASLFVWLDRSPRHAGAGCRTLGNVTPP